MIYNTVFRQFYAIFLSLGRRCTSLPPLKYVRLWIEANFRFHCQFAFYMLAWMSIFLLNINIDLLNILCLACFATGSVFKIGIGYCNFCYCILAITYSNRSSGIKSWMLSRFLKSEWLPDIDWLSTGRIMCGLDGLAVSVCHIVFQPWTWMLAG